jgi:hypothetical protein
MSMAIVHQVLAKSQTRNSARTLLLTLALHANECCGVAWASDATLRREANVSRQRVHELKNALEEDGELVIVERPGTTNLYFVAAHGQPLGPQGDYQTTKRGQHLSSCPLRKGGVSDVPDTQVSDPPDRGCQECLTQQQTKSREKTNYVNVGSALEHAVDTPEELHAADLVDEIVHQFENEPGRRAYQRVIHALGCDITYRLLLNTLEKEDDIRGPLGAYFIGACKREAQRQSIDLGFKRTAVGERKA